MMQALDILKTAYRSGIEPSMDLLYQKEQSIPGSINYSIRRYYAQHPWVAEDTGMMVYHYNEKNKKENYLELRYCIAGNRYCEDNICVHCGKTPQSCNGKQQTVDVFVFQLKFDFLWGIYHR